MLTSACRSESGATSFAARAQRRHKQCRILRRLMLGVNLLKVEFCRSREFRRIRKLDVVIRDDATFILELVDGADLATVEFQPHSGTSAILRNELDAG